jgi:nucleotide-binding universal stress UspA family protein
VSLDAPHLALQGAAASAGLLVVGSHGRGALLRAALGSVSSSLLRSAPCPVVVVRPRPVHPEPDLRPEAPLVAPLTFL